MTAFTDNLDVISDLPIVVLARISLLSTSEGGRHTPLIGNIPYRPNHNFGGEENFNFHIGQIDITEGDLVYPGESRELSVCFLPVRGLLEKLTVGKKWRLQEGATLIGYAEVLEIET